MEIVTCQATTKLLQEAYDLIRGVEDLNTAREKLELQLKKAIDLSWKDGNLFEAYFEEFSEFISGMHQMDFSKRLYTNDDKESFLNFIAHSLNSVNEELEEKALNVDIMPEVLNSLKVNNRIVLVSKDMQIVSNTFTNVKTLQNGILCLKGELLANVIGRKTLNKAISNEHKSYCIEQELRHPVFADLSDKEALLEITNMREYSILTITLYPENRLIRQLPRILEIISMFKEQYEDNPKIPEALFGTIISLEVNSIYNDLKAYLQKEDMLSFE